MREDDDGQFRSVRDPLRRARPAPPHMLNWMNAVGVLLRLVCSGMILNAHSRRCSGKTASDRRYRRERTSGPTAAL